MPSFLGLERQLLAYPLHTSPTAARIAPSSSYLRATLQLRRSAPDVEGKQCLLSVPARCTLLRPAGVALYHTRAAWPLAAHLMQRRRHAPSPMRSAPVNIRQMQTLQGEATMAGATTGLSGTNIASTPAHSRNGTTASHQGFIEECNIFLRSSSLSNLAERRHHAHHHSQPRPDAGRRPLQHR